jgi:hypothetical protein
LVVPSKLAGVSFDNPPVFRFEGSACLGTGGKIPARDPSWVRGKYPSIVGGP